MLRVVESSSHILAHGFRVRCALNSRGRNLNDMDGSRRGCPPAPVTMAIT